MICIIGNRGNMGQRWTAILRMLDFDFCGVDQGEEIPKADHYIIATPTDTHYSVLTRIRTQEKSIVLCEKPISKDTDQLMQMVQMYGERLCMTNNWMFLGERFRRFYGNITYNYFKTGNDGLGWDLIQPIYMATILTANNLSPVFYCDCGGQIFTQKDFDLSYVKMIQSFLKGETANMMSGNEILIAHSKARRYYGTLVSNSGTQHVKPIA